MKVGVVFDDETGTRSEVFDCGSWSVKNGTLTLWNDDGKPGEAVGRGIFLPVMLPPRPPSKMMVFAPGNWRHAWETADGE